MTKIRSSNIKPKVQKGDFAKKKAKVGRKVQRENVTEIKVKTKRINVPLQNKVSAEEVKTQREALNLINKQLRHYHEPARLAALAKLRDMLNSDTIVESFVTLVLPEVSELLFNEASETRTSVREVLEIMFLKYGADDFAPVASIFMTYVGSGLTHLHKGVRKDALIVLRTVAQRCPSILTSYLDKIVTNILGLLEESFQAVSVPLLQLQSQTSSGSVNPADSSISAKNGKPTMFILILEALTALLEYTTTGSLSSRTAGASASAGASAGNDIRSSASYEFAFESSSASNSFIELAQLRQETSITGRQSVDDGDVSMTVAGGNVISNATAMSILRHMRRVWQNLAGIHSNTMMEEEGAHGSSLSSTSLSIDVLPCLSMTMRTLLCILPQVSEASSRSTAVASFDELSRSQLNPTTQQGRASLAADDDDAAFLKETVQGLFQAFPHCCTEVSLAASGSSLEQAGLRTVEQLNLTICEIAIVYINKHDEHLRFDPADFTGGTHPAASAVDGRDSDHPPGAVHARKHRSLNSMEQLRSVACRYLLGRMQLHVDRIQRNCSEPPSSQLDKSTRSAATGDRSTSRSSNEKHVLAAAAVSLPVAPRQVREEDKNSVERIFESIAMTVFHFSQSMLRELLLLLKDLFQAVDSTATTFTKNKTNHKNNGTAYGNGGHMRRSVNYIFTPAVKCLCNIVQHLLNQLDQPGSLLFDSIHADNKITNNNNNNNSDSMISNNNRTATLTASSAADIYTLILEILIQATELVLDATWDLRVLFNDLVSTMLSVVQGRAFYDDAEDDDDDDDDDDAADGGHHSNGYGRRDDDAVNNHLQDERQKLSECYLNIWKASSEQAENFMYSSSTTPPPLVRNGYTSDTMTQKEKFSLLSIYLYMPFEDLVEATNTILSALTTNLVPLNISSHAASHDDDDEMSFFLRLVYQRRQEMAVGDVVDVLFDGLKNFIISTCNCVANTPTSIAATNHSSSNSSSANRQNNSDSSSSHSVGMECVLRTLQRPGGWFAHDVARVLYWMSSAEAPQKIVFYLSSTLRRWEEEALSIPDTRQFTDKDKDKESDKEKEVVAGKDHMVAAVDASVAAHSATAASTCTCTALMMKSAILTMSAQLLTPWTPGVYAYCAAGEGGITSDLRDLANDSHGNDNNLRNPCSSSSSSSSSVASEKEAIDLLLSIVARVAASLLLNVNSDSRHLNSGFDAQEQFVLSSIGSLMGIKLLVLSSNPGADTSFSGPASIKFDYLVFKEIIHQILVRPLPIVNPITVLRNLHAVMQSGSFDDNIFIACRSELEFGIDHLSSSFQNSSILSNDEKLLAQNLGKDILMLF